MNFSLIQIENINPDKSVDGYWLQDFSGKTLEEASMVASELEEFYNHRIRIAVIEQLSGTNIDLNPYRKGLKDIRKLCNYNKMLHF